MQRLSGPVEQQVVSRQPRGGRPRVLHVGFGFAPWMINGLIIYVESLMQGQAQAGLDVGYFFAGRQLPMFRRPFLHRWRRGEVRMFEWLNSTVVVGRHQGTRDPERDLGDAGTERAFTRVLARFGPDLIHVHDLGGLPSSILTVGRDHDLPVVMTLHDYQSLCPTIKLFDADGRICTRLRPGDMCTVCCAHAPADNHDDVDRTLRYERARIRSSVPHLDAALRRPAIRAIGDAGIRLTEREGPDRTSGSGPPAASARSAEPAAYDRRREVNLIRLSELDALVTFSERSRDVCRALGVEGSRIRTLRMTPRHVEELRPKRSPEPHNPLRFAALNAASSPQKGAHVLVDALAELTQRGLDDRFQLSIWGWVAPDVREALAAHPSVLLPGVYGIDKLDDMLEDIDVGVVPSVWEEVYGFVGLEYLAKGIPVIGSALGGIPEYVRPGQTGWLNQTSSAAELADLMAAAIEDPGQVRRLGRTAIELRDELITPFSSQLAELSELYERVLSRHRALPRVLSPGAPVDSSQSP